MGVFAPITWTLTLEWQHYMKSDVIIEISEIAN